MRICPGMKSRRLLSAGGLPATPTVATIQRVIESNGLAAGLAENMRDAIAHQQLSEQVARVAHRVELCAVAAGETMKASRWVTIATP